MFWVLKRTVPLKRFSRVPTTYVCIEKFYSELPPLIWMKISSKGLPNSATPDRTVSKRISLFVCVDVLCPSQQFLSCVMAFSCVPGLNQSCAENTQRSVSGESQTSSLATLQFQVKLSTD